MKHIRNILLLITIIFAFVMQAEVYQNMLWNFNGAYYLSSRYTTTNDDMDSFLANAEDTAEKHGVHSISQPEFWQSTETDMMFIVWGLVAILMIVLNMIEVIRRQKEVVVRASLGENAAVIALKAVVADMISYAALFVLAKLLVSQFISGAYEDHLILAVYCAGAVLSVIPYAAFVRFDVKKAFANASDKKGKTVIIVTHDQGIIEDEPYVVKI